MKLVIVLDILQYFTHLFSWFFHIYLEYESLKLGKNHILIYGDIYDCMDSINKIIVTDSDGESIIHKVNTYYE